MNEIILYDRWKLGNFNSFFLHRFLACLSSTDVSAGIDRSWTGWSALRLCACHLGHNQFSVTAIDPEGFWTVDVSVFEQSWNIAIHLGWNIRCFGCGRGVLLLASPLAIGWWTHLQKCFSAINFTWLFHQDDCNDHVLYTDFSVLLSIYRSNAVAAYSLTPTSLLTTPCHLDVAMKTPISTPRVFDQPLILPFLCSISHDCYSMVNSRTTIPAWNSSFMLLKFHSYAYFSCDTYQWQ